MTEGKINTCYVASCGGRKTDHEIDHLRRFWKIWSEMETSSGIGLYWFFIVSLLFASLSHPKNVWYWNNQDFTYHLPSFIKKIMIDNWLNLKIPPLMHMLISQNIVITLECGEFYWSLLSVFYLPYYLVIM